MTLDPEPPEVGPIRRKLFGLVPLRQLPQVLRQVLRWVNFLEPFRERVEADLRIDDLYDRLLFVLVGEGCNIGLETMAAATNRYSYNQLAHIASRCLHPEVIKKAIARVIDHHQKMRLTPLWGKGIWSSADGQLFPISHRSLRSRRHPKAPFAMRVVNLVTHVLDTLVSYSSVLLQTTSHENRYHLDGLLHHEADVHPRKHTSDTAGYTDVTFCWAISLLTTRPNSRLILRTFTSVFVSALRLQRPPKLSLRCVFAHLLGSDGLAKPCD